ncbi:putative LRR receptor-like serine/threonine-protein kinase [Cocos nucifera]|uniref:Putative LRR receptor-like serine/threonine-protein kinase n=1 Tax=Cocos nucifera TaxID=13894 RepID=A0A8K0I7N2_COCNU|nr:putative LRR receptor-like serine/threonine-protein kinase [Cocos nucifera]
MVVVFLSIDCGSSDTYSDELNITWVGDDNYIQNGQSLTLNDPGLVSQAMTTLRVFDSRRKNCYPIGVSGGGQILVRASFYYGNYDGKSSPPSFGLQFDANSWTTVETAMDQVVWYEAVYVVNGDATSVCVAQTQPNQLPFISAIEARSLDPDMYAKVFSKDMYALFLRRRAAFGADDTVRYPHDLYDRIWDPSAVTNGCRALVSDATFVNTGKSDRPPATVLKTAVESTDVSSSMRLPTWLPPNEVPIYVNMYFTEMSSLSAAQKRSFDIFVDGAGEFRWRAMVPRYRDVTEYYIIRMANSSTAFTLVATTDSTLPPIISAMEVFVISDVLSNGTNANDVETLVLLQQQFGVLKDWSGDPCLPASYNWDWLNCSSDVTPRITALYLSGFGLSGVLPDFSALDALEIIDLRNNSFSGDFPEFLGNFPNLRELNLADNGFSGSIPSSLTQNTKLKLERRAPTTAAIYKRRPNERAR